MAIEFAIPHADVAATLAECEALIESGFRQAGTALCRIRDGRLYLSVADTFEGYCKTRWGISSSMAYRQIAAAQVASDHPTITNESQARALADVVPAQRSAVVDAVAASGAGMTAAQIRYQAEQAGSLKPSVSRASRTDAAREQRSGSDFGDGDFYDDGPAGHSSTGTPTLDFDDAIQAMETLLAGLRLRQADARLLFSKAERSWIHRSLCAVMEWMGR